MLPSLIKNGGEHWALHQKQFNTPMKETAQQLALVFWQLGKLF